MTDINSKKRMTPEDSALVLVDHQTGLCTGVADQSQTEFLNSVLGLAQIGKVFDLPTIISTSFAEGPNGPLISELAALFPDTPVVHRPGEINAWDNPDFVAAIKATNRKNMIIAGVSTEVCVAFLALSLVKEGYGVYAVIDASGTWNKLVAEVAVARMIQAGVVPVTWLAVGAELQRDWRRATGQPLAAAMSSHLPFSSFGRGTFAANQKRLQSR
jgi:nicotinamidase-related amidase